MPPLLLVYAKGEVKETKW